MLFSFLHQYILWEIFAPIHFTRCVRTGAELVVWGFSAVQVSLRLSPLPKINTSTDTNICEKTQHIYMWKYINIHLKNTYNDYQDSYYQNTSICFENRDKKVFTDQNNGIRMCLHACIWPRIKYMSKPNCFAQAEGGKKRLNLPSRRPIISAKPRRWEKRGLIIFRMVALFLDNGSHPV